jgi:hypothetical protein
MNADGSLEVVFHRGDDRIRAYLQPVEHVRSGHNYGGTWYRVWTGNLGSGLDTERKAHGLLRYRNDVFSMPYDGPIRPFDSDPASRWVEGFPEPGDLRRWALVEVGGEWLTAPEAATYLSCAVGRRVRVAEVRGLRSQDNVDFVRFGHYRHPLIWEGSLGKAASLLV